MRYLQGLPVVRGGKQVLIGMNSGQCAVSLMEALGGYHHDLEEHLSFVLAPRF